jgi:hypothetical protein
VRQERVAPLIASLDRWMRAARSKMSRHADVAKAMDYMLKRWDAFTCFLGDGRICLTNNAAARVQRGIAMAGSLCMPSSSAGNIGRVFASSPRHGRPFRTTAALTVGEARSAVRI